MARHESQGDPRKWRSVGQRSSPYHLAANLSAAHPVNAILKYAYATLESEIRIKTISDGYDPTIGIMHEGREGSSQFIFDLMEPERPRVDQRCSILSEAMFSIPPTL
jgi:CRISP-associated protein Cas1